MKHIYVIKYKPYLKSWDGTTVAPFSTAATSFKQAIDIFIAVKGEDKAKQITSIKKKEEIHLIS